jgi:two-component system, NarL family, sensor histidine kinase UhpB
LDIHPQLRSPQPHPTPLSNITGHWTHRTKTGKLMTVQIINQPLEMNGRKTAMMIATDITEQTIAAEKIQRSHENLRALSDRLQSVREEERTQIAREIHDELGQILTAIRMDLSWLANKLHELAPQFNGIFQTHTSSMTTLVDSAIHTVRKISTELRPQILDDLGLVAAIEWQAHEFQTRTGINCTFISNVEDIRLDRKQATALFRILQESLTNIARHAKATKTRITLSAHIDAILLEIIDDGIGIEEEEITNIKSLGLLGMHERTVLLGGIFSIQNTPEGRGTMVSVQLPLSQGSFGKSS